MLVAGQCAILGLIQSSDTPMAAAKQKDRVTVPVERVQTGVRLEKRLLKVLKGLAESLDLSLGDLLEGMALHALENKPPFSAATLKKIADLKRVYGLDLTAVDSHRLREKP
jgi:predicted DNA-binding ribbon-helix-helix protein